MLNEAPPPEETPEVLLKIHLRILFPPGGRFSGGKNKTLDYRKFFELFFIITFFISN